ncbi:hypothetical protein LPJ61_003011 [Coemansia biformis]|uniref:Uncharacterized protein n=1 Tax=Coemansia biformis TaxID=1286918 RepID=A0A9W7Y7A3_9FUNG|nr:hypothetical protein LPJ61_003011 [Coemansia biformis]
MLGSRRLRGIAAVDNKENAALGTAARPGKAGLLGAKDGAGGGPSGKSAVSDSPSLSVLTPRAKAFGTKQQPARTGLREVLQTPSAGTRMAGPAATCAQDQAPKTIKRRQGLFSPSSHMKGGIVATQGPAQLLEPEYAPPKPAALEFDAVGAFGFDLDIGLVPLTQLSTAGSRAAVLPAPDLALEELADVATPPSLVSGLARIPSFDMLAMPLLACTPAPLVATALYPTRIPRLKRKR